MKECDCVHAAQYARLREMICNIACDVKETRNRRKNARMGDALNYWSAVYGERLEELKDLIYIWKGTRF